MNTVHQNVLGYCVNLALEDADTAQPTRAGQEQARWAHALKFASRRLPIKVVTVAMSCLASSAALCVRTVRGTALSLQLFNYKLRGWRGGGARRAAVAGTVLLLGVTGCHGGGKAPPDMSGPGGQATVFVFGYGNSRFPDDANSNDVVDLPESAAYVQAPIRVTLDASNLARSYPSTYPFANKESAGFGSTSGPWRWTLIPANAASMEQDPVNLQARASDVPGLTSGNRSGSITTYSQMPVITLDLYEGEWSVELARVDAGGRPIYWKTFSKSIDDVVIAQGGDSWSSGDGAPDRPRGEGSWGDDGTGGNGSHRGAHRSSLTWGSIYAQDVSGLAALAGLAGAARVTTVTYINVAKSGALIDDMPGQLERLAGMIGTRKVDKFLMSIGGNDAGFSQAIAAYMAREPIGEDPVDIVVGPSLPDILDSIHTGQWSGGPFADVGSALLQLGSYLTDTKFRNVRGFRRLRAGYRELAGMLEARGIVATNVHILQYSDPLVPFPGDLNFVCPDAILTDVARIAGRRLEIGRHEQRHAREKLITPLNQMIADAAAELQWKVVPAETAMYAHAICSDSPYIVGYSQSLTNQGDKDGTLHPNAEGYRAIAEVLIKSE